MLEGLIGTEDGERVLLFLAARGSGYGRQIADYWQTNIYGIQRQLERFEQAGILVQRPVGRTRLYEWNPRWAFREELQAMLGKAIDFLPNNEQQRLLESRKRPRRKAKPL
jgi:hypothetical protein